MTWWQEASQTIDRMVNFYLTACASWKQYCEGPPPAQIWMSKHCKRSCNLCDEPLSCPAKTTKHDLEGPLFVPVLDRNRKPTIIKRRGKDRREKNKSQPWHLAPREEYFKPENFVHLRGKMFDSECNELNQPSDWINIWYAGATSMERGREGYYYIWQGCWLLLGGHIRSLPEEPHLAWVGATFLDFRHISWAYFLCKWAKILICWCLTLLQ